MAKSTAVAVAPAQAPVSTRQTSFTHVVEHWPTYLQIAQTLSKSGKTGEVRQADSIMAVLIQGAELGLSPMTAINMIHPVQGKLTIGASAAQALVLRDLPGSKFEIKEGADFCEITLTAPGREPYTAKYTLEDAKKAGLVKGGSNWEKSPKDMLFSKAVLRACRRVAPDVLAGMYAPEELGESFSSGATIDVEARETVAPAPSLPSTPVENATPSTSAPVKPIEVIDVKTTETKPAATTATATPTAAVEAPAVAKIEPAKVADMIPVTSTVSAPMPDQAPGTQSSVAQHLEMKRLLGELKMAPSEFRTLFQSQAKPRHIEKATELNFAEADRFIRLLRVRLKEMEGGAPK